jgi:class 3 adenylate cyclase
MLTAIPAFYGPATGKELEEWAEWVEVRKQSQDARAVFVPLPYKEHAGKLDDTERDDLISRGYAFEHTEFPDLGKGFLEKGVVSHSRLMAVIFCDMKRSTEILRELGGEGFHGFQAKLALLCIESIEEVNKCAKKARAGVDGTEPPWERLYPRVVLDKMMGDGFLVYVDCGTASDDDLLSMAGQRAQAAASMALQFIDRLIRKALEAAPYELQARTRLGLRFGLALGGGITLSVLAAVHGGGFTRGDFTLTGETVNLAARLEHASSADFLSSIEANRQRLAPYLNRIEDRDRLRGTRLLEDLLSTDQQTIHLYETCEKDFEIRVDERFRHALAVNPKIERFAWRRVPFAPKGFGDGHWAYLLGGNSVSELFRQV